MKNLTRKQKKVLFRIIISAFLFILAVILPKIFEGLEKFPIFFYLVPYIVISYDVIIKSLKNICHGEVFDENFLMMIASFGAFFIKEYPEAVLVILLYQVGELFQGIAVGKSRSAVKALASLCPKNACVIRGGEEISLSPNEVNEGETIVIRPGERIPLDGEIVYGETDIDTSAFTGEPIPRSYGIGDTVMSGTLNISGVIKVRVSGKYEDSTIAKIVALVGESSTKKAEVENFISKFAKYYTPIVVISALLLATLPPLIFSESFSDWLTRALIFLVVSCPCALVISVPLSFFGGIGGASRSGILIKGASYLEILSRVDTFVFDKTGTLTEGVFEVKEIHSKKISENELLELSALAESYSNHPIGRSITESHGKEIDKSRVNEVNELAGFGISAVIDGKTLLVGNRKLMEKYSLTPENTSNTAVHIAFENEYLGYIVLSDKIKSDAKDMLDVLKKEGVTKTVMLTGDSYESANAVSNKLGIDETYSSLLPEDKVSHIQKIIDSKKSKSYVAFVGDGINDAPVMSLADISIAMGKSGSDVAIEASDVVLMSDSLINIAYAVRRAKKTMRIVRENIIFALGSKAAVLILGALGYANMYLALFADVGVLIIATLNAMRALKKEKQKIVKGSEINA